MTQLTFSNKVINFYQSINPPEIYRSDVEVIRSYLLPEVKINVNRFYNKFFSDNNNRVFVFGINPGRFGSGITGIPFTDPVALEKYCGIKNSFKKRRELSSEFIYSFIENWGGIRAFYNNFFLTAVSPIGFIHDGVNYNYYDSSEFFLMIKPFIADTINSQIKFGARRKTAIILGTGENQKYFNLLNQEYGFFDNVFAVEHPRFIMQYQRKNLSTYLKKYNDVFSRALI